MTEEEEAIERIAARLLVLGLDLEKLVRRVDDLREAVRFLNAARARDAGRRR